MLPDLWLATSLRIAALQRNLMPLDDNRRAVLTMAALTYLAELKRKISQTDPQGMATIEPLERMVINGTVEDRDDVLKKYEAQGSFDWALTAEPV
jgi:hypothetical protein